MAKGIPAREREREMLDFLMQWYSSGVDIIWTGTRSQGGPLRLSKTQNRRPKAIIRFKYKLAEPSLKCTLWMNVRRMVAWLFLWVIASSARNYATGAAKKARCLSKTLQLLIWSSSHTFMWPSHLTGILSFMFAFLFCGVNHNMQASCHSSQHKPPLRGMFSYIDDWETSLGSMAGRLMAFTVHWFMNAGWGSVSC